MKVKINKEEPKIIPKYNNDSDDDIFQDAKKEMTTNLKSTKDDINDIFQLKDVDLTTLLKPYAKKK